MTNAQKPIPIFEMYTIQELHERLGHSERYLLDIRDGNKSLNPRFRLTAAGILNQTQKELFGEAEPESALPAAERASG